LFLFMVNVFLNLLFLVVFKLIYLFVFIYGECIFKLVIFSYFWLLFWIASSSLRF